jgi:hypothetical protein
MAIPGHATFGVIMGAGYAQAKCLAAAGNEPAAAKARAPRPGCWPPWPTAPTTSSLWAGRRDLLRVFHRLIVLGVTLARGLRKARRPGESLRDGGEENRNNPSKGALIMSKNKDYKPEDIAYPEQAIVNSELVHEMTSSSYIEYAMSVIVGAPCPTCGTV